MDDQGKTAAESPQASPPGSVPLDAWLDDQEAERRALIMRLRQIERNLMAHGRLRSLPQPVLTGKRNGTGR